MKLIIVESPAKARTISRFLGKGYEVASSYGHIRDLPGSAAEIPAKFKKEPWARLGVNPEDGYRPIYVVSKDSKPRVAELKKLLKKADEILLATDEDREGEAISWHLLEVLEPSIPVKRITFHEITKGAIEAALDSPREIDLQVVRAQEGRRILDRLFGYSLSPVLWKKVRTRLSAGRVQSVAVRLVVEREEERQAFHDAEYFDIEARMAAGDLAFTARLTTLDGLKIAAAKDFDPDTGLLLKADRRAHLDPASAAALAAGAKGTMPWRVLTVEAKETVQRPSPPFTTSTLQQAASSRLRMSPTRVMRIAQRLYEGVSLGGDREGLITYMRTDSLTISEKALAEAETVIAGRFGAEFTTGPRRYRTKSKGAQEAHEAIRPTVLSRTPDEVASSLDGDELAVYTLIWNRTVASQMADARLDKTAVDFGVTVSGKLLVLRANGSVVKFPGFLGVYGRADRDSVLPPLSEGQTVGGPGNTAGVEIRDVEALRHQTQPPARYTEASLIKKLEEEGIGRPSTYATVISTIQSREYVVKKSGALLPSWIGIAVTHLLRGHFNHYIDLKFTARMEEDLDRIAAGEIDWVEFLDCFYRGCEKDGDDGLEATIEREMDLIEFPRIPVGEDPQTGQPIALRIGRNYVSVEVNGDEEKRATVPVDMLVDELDAEKAMGLIHQKLRSKDPIGRHPETGQNIYALVGPFGPYLQLGEQEDDKKPKRISLGKKTDPATIDMDYALRLLSLPREIGTDPETGKPVRAGLGRYGPYVERDRVFASVQTVDTLFTITLEEALERVRNKNRKPVLRELGDHPQTGKALQILKGRYGPYITDGVVNATIGKDADPDDVTMDEAVSLLAEAAVRAKNKKPTAKKKTAKKKTTKKKTATKKTTTRKKAAAKKTVRKKAVKKVDPARVESGDDS
ncbi:type I DNA topoisomerase [bacterium CG17_big_fil_post_rev_8_21_14_2_50_64_8]|nr:MAG: type I DNA topoisomerase [bacterium CG17_big_fil_post_rev_8_21_14_2_50_64_8]PJA75492.1 MAG: type I DNA topoisomerase [bacterium CG_4_9_14_3_um_filter_65_15]